MAVTYQALMACETAFVQSGAAYCDDDVGEVVRTIFAAYGGPLQPTDTCPAGEEPPHWRGVKAAAIAAANAERWFELDEAEDIAVEQYVLERYELAHSAYRARYAYCGWGQGEPPAPPTPPPAGEVPAFPPSPGRARGEAPVETSSVQPIGVLFIAIGLGMYVAGKRKFQGAR